MKLAIISHTEHYKSSDGTLVGWGPTITEINYLLAVFDTIYHVSMFHDTTPPASALPYISDRIIFVPLPVLGGHTIGAKLELLNKSPVVFKIISNTLKEVDWFQFRGPTGIGVYVIPFLKFCVKKPGWFKYAGNWNQENPPLGYRFQRWILKQQSRKVTINGRWEDQPMHSLSFENPCLTMQDVLEGNKISKQKSIEGPLTYCFVGRLEKPKGVERIIKAMASLSYEDKLLVKAVHLVGMGPELKYFQSLAAKSDINFLFHGALPREKVFEIYKISEVFLMPTTASEGFPKVIAEAMNFGCLPIVSNISSIGQYIKDNETGICLENVSSEHLKNVISALSTMSSEHFSKMLINQREIVEKFTFDYYNNRIKLKIIQ